MSGRWLPNAISFARAVLVLPVAWSILERRDGTALALIAVAGVSDALDGLLAKRFDWVTRFGALLDPAADKVFMAGSFLAAVAVGLVPVWLTVIVIGRDLVIVLGAFLFQWRAGYFQPQPSLLSKVNTFLQIVLVFAVVARHGGGPVSLNLVMALVAAVTLTTLASGAHYLVRWGRRFSGVARHAV